jgi:hypothetical protein
MDASEPHLRRRGLFADLGAGDPDTGEHESTEGISIRVGFARPRLQRSIVSAATRRPATAVRPASAESVSSAHESAAFAGSAFRSAIATGTRQPGRTPR